MAFVDINPAYRETLARQGLAAPENFLRLPGVIISGHPDRNVARLTIGSGAATVPAFLKREHCVRWRERWANARAGFGLASRSAREAQTLRALRQAGIGCPDWIAVGENDRGRAFLLLAAIPDTVDLQQFLRGPAAAQPTLRSALARRLGAAQARMHEAGFDHPDLYSKHVLVKPQGLSIHFLDWQRTSRRRRLGWRQRQRDLAALDATLADSLATPRERLLCLRSYLAGVSGPERPALGSLARAVRRQAEGLLRKRHIRAARNCPQPLGTQGILWLDEEALCVTWEFWKELDGKVPPWLESGITGRGAGSVVTRTQVMLPGGQAGVLVHARRTQPLHWLWAAFRGRPLMSAEVRQAGALFQARRHGLPGPRLLAFGQRCHRPWRTESFLLTEATVAESGREP